jgi:hypothetical protein
MAKFASFTSWFETISSSVGRGHYQLLHLLVEEKSAECFSDRSEAPASRAKRRAFAYQRVRSGRRLTVLASHIPESMLADAMTAAFSITDTSAPLEALVGLASRHPQPARTHVIAYALTAACDITDDYHRVQALLVLAPHLTEPLLNDAITTACAVTDERSRAWLLRRLAQ